MTALFTILFILTIIAIVGVTIWSSNHQSKLNQVRERAKEQNYEDSKIDQIIADNQFPLPVKTRVYLAGTAAVFLMAAMFNSVMFYAEPGYKYHVRLLTSFGGLLKLERAVTTPGYNLKLFGRATPWKDEMSVQSSSEGSGMNTDNEGTMMSANLPPFKVTMLDQVDARVKATTRFRLPDDEMAFLNIANKYRTPGNLLRTSLIPQFQETLKATSALMSAEEYYSGGITQFQNEFENQMTSGIYVVRRVEKLVKNTRQSKGSANASKGAKQDDYGDGHKVTYVVEKVLDNAGQPKIKVSKLAKLGISVEEVRVTDLEPNKEFVARMKLKQKASADRAIAREQRIQEEEQKLLAEAKGEREVAQEQAKAKKIQIKQTTEAETEKQLAVTKATKLLEQAKIERKTAAEALARDRIKAKSVEVLANAEAYKRRKLIVSDNGLKLKLDAMVKMNSDNAAAHATRKVPTTVIYQGGGGKNGLGTDNDIRSIAQTQMLKNLKALDLDMKVKQ